MRSQDPRALLLRILQYSTLFLVEVKVFLPLFRTIVAIPLSLWWRVHANTREMEPFPLAVLAITSYHVAEADPITVAVCPIVSSSVTVCIVALVSNHV
jgi:hypothetical protein